MFVRQRKEVTVAEQDRRVRRTRRILHEALISLILDNGYEQITVQDILDRADVGRSTFYVHYRDKEALLAASFDDIRDRLREEFETAEDRGATINPARPAALVFEHAHRHQRVYRALCGKQGGNLVYRHLHNLIHETLTKHLEPFLSQARSDLPADIVAQFYTSTALGLLTWWIDHDFSPSPAWLATTYQRLTTPEAPTSPHHDRK
jgi:AcrR family transcriptional regulator